MRNLAFLELRLEKLTVSKPFRAKNPTIYIIMQDFHLAIVLGIKDKTGIFVVRENSMRIFFECTIFAMTKILFLISYLHI